MGAIIGDPGRLDLGHGSADHFVVLIMDACRQSGFGDGGKAFFQEGWGDARKADRIGAEGRELERGDAGFGLFGNASGPLLRVDCSVKRKIDAGLRAGMLDLDAHSLGRADKIALVIGHVDNGGDPARGCRAGGPDEVFLVFLAQRMGLGVNSAGQNHGFAEIMAVGRLGASALTHQSDLAIAHGDVAAFNDAVREDDGAGEAEVEVGHVQIFQFSGAGTRALPGSAGQGPLYGRQAVIDEHRKHAHDEPTLQDEGGIAG